ncbi:MAG: polysaccharide biosynthesis C-terminal domain-containing protein [Fusobacteriaceae bacterium]
MNSKLIKNYLFNVIIIFINIIFPILVFPYASRILLPTQYGKYSFAISITSYFIAIANLGVQSYGVRELSKINKENLIELKNKFSEILAITVISSIGSSILFVITILYFKILRIELELYLIIGTTVLLSFMNLDYFFVAMENHRRRTMRLLITRSISLIFLFILVKNPEDYIIFTSVMILPEIIVKIMDIFSVRKYISLKLSFPCLKKHIKPLLIIFFFIFSQTIYMNLDSTMLGAIIGNKSVGLYAVAVKMTKIVLPLVSSLGLVLTPRIIKNIADKNEESFFKDMDLNLNFIFFITVPAIFSMLILANNMIEILSGQDYRDSITSMRVMLPIIFFISISGFISSQILIPTNNEKKILKISVIGLLINFILNLLLIKKYGILGAGIATLMAEFFVMFFRIREMEKIFSTYKIFSAKRIIYILAGVISFVSGVIVKKVISIENIYIEFVFVFIFYSILYIFILIWKKEYFVIKFITYFKNKFVGGEL